MTNKILALCSCLALLAFSSCQTNDTPESQSSNSATSNYESSHEILKPGSDSETSEFEEIESLLSKSDVHNSLDTSGALAQSDTRSVPERYLPFQGKWRVVSMEDTKPKNSDPPEIFVAVTGRTFELSGAGVTESLQNAPPDALEFMIPATKRDRPYRVLRDRGAIALDDIVDVENQIMVFWYVGLFDLTDDKLHLALKYCGQGVEGDQFKNFRPPSSLDEKPIDGEIRVSLERNK